MSPAPMAERRPSPPASRPVPAGPPRVVPSLLAADFADVRGAVARLGVADWVSVDVMDGHFVPNLSFGPDLVAALRKGPGPRLWMDAHLMVDEPGRFGPVFASAGADWVIVHLEACRRPRPLLKALAAAGVGVGLALKPQTPARALVPFLAELDLALVMTVEPGFGGQGFLEGVLPKVRELRAEIDRRGLKTWLQVDGGIGPGTAARAAAAGADCLVAGSAVFRAADPAAAFRAIEREASENFRVSGR